MGEPNETLRSIARIAGKAIEKQREQRRHTGVSDEGSVQALLLYLTVIKQWARDALPEGERASLPPDETRNSSGNLRMNFGRQSTNVGLGGRPSIDAADICRT